MNRVEFIKGLAPLFCIWFLVAWVGISVMSRSGGNAATDASVAAPVLPAPTQSAEQAKADSARTVASAIVVADVSKGIQMETVAASVNAIAAAPHPVTEVTHSQLQQQSIVDGLCEQIGNKLGSVSVEDCLRHRFVFGGGFSVNQRPLVIKEYQPLSAAPEDFRVLIMGGIHGDEYSSISILFKWLALFSPLGPEGAFHWRFAPLVNPDGLLADGKALRQNANGVDLNRNFPSQDWSATAARHWQDNTGSNPRRFPGSSAGSEPEVQWVVEQIEDFQPDVIVSVHAPYHLLDFDGPARAPDKIGELYLHQLGVYPGSLGNFAGLNQSIPVVTLELPSAGIMPPSDQINLMWRDLVAWLDREGRKALVN